MPPDADDPPSQPSGPQSGALPPTAVGDADDNDDAVTIPSTVDERSALLHRVASQSPPGSPALNATASFTAVTAAAATDDEPQSAPSAPPTVLPPLPPQAGPRRPWDVLFVIALLAFGSYMIVRTTPLATNTSFLKVTDVMRDVERKDRCGGLHFFNPVPVMKLVEVVRMLETSDPTYEALVTFSKDIGKKPVSCKASKFYIKEPLCPSFCFRTPLASLSTVCWVRMSRTP